MDVTGDGVPTLRIQRNGVPSLVVTEPDIDVEATRSMLFSFLGVRRARLLWIESLPAKDAKAASLLQVYSHTSLPLVALTPLANRELVREWARMQGVRLISVFLFGERPKETSDLCIVIACAGFSLAEVCDGVLTADTHKEQNQARVEGLART